MISASAPLLCPFTVVCDTREQLVFSFAGLRSDAKDGRRPLIVPIQSGKLDQGDYSLLGFERRIAVERKGPSDLFASVGRERRRFFRELERLADVCEVSAVVCEIDWNAIITAPPERSKLPPKIIYRSVMSWQQRFPSIHWYMMPGRRMAEITTFRILEWFWRAQKQRREVKKPPRFEIDLCSVCLEKIEQMEKDGVAN